MHTLTRALGKPLAAVLMVTAMSGTAVVATAGPAAAMDCRIDVQAAVIRAKPDAESTAMGIGYRGQTCQTSDHQYNGSTMWTKIRMDKSGVKGWVRREHLWTEEDDIHTRLL